jgi:hypothetical protein
VPPLPPAPELTLLELLLLELPPAPELELPALLELDVPGVAPPVPLSLVPSEPVVPVVLVLQAAMLTAPVTQEIISQCDFVIPSSLRPLERRC